MTIKEVLKSLVDYIDPPTEIKLRTWVGDPPTMRDVEIRGVYRCPMGYVVIEADPND